MAESTESTIVDATSSRHHRQQSTGEHSAEPNLVRRSSRISRRPTGGEPTSPHLPFSLRRATTMMLTPEKRIGPAPGVLKSFKAILMASWLNVLLIFIPISWALNFALKDTDENKDTLVFVFSFLAIIPLAKLLAFATDELSMRVGQTLAGLLNATLGNAVELIVAIIALVKCELQIVQSSLVGSILSNLLLVLGMCFFAGGVKYSEQGFGTSASQLNSSLLTISVIAVLLPAAFHFSVPGDSAQESSDILSLSHGVAIILLFIYGAYLFFQLYSHATLYDDSSDDIFKSTRYPMRPTKIKLQDMIASPSRSATLNSSRTTPASRTATFSGHAPPAISSTSHSHTMVLGPHGGHDIDANNDGRDVEGGETDDDKEEEVPQMSVPMTIALLVLVTVFVAVTAEWLVDSIDGLTQHGGISREFVGVILLPIVGNAAEHVTAVTVSVKDKLTLSLGVAVGSSIQIALFVIPFIITLGWIMGRPLTLLFDPYESISLFLAVLTVNYVVQDGKSNWLEGVILMCLYAILGVTFWFYPGSNLTCST